MTEKELFREIGMIKEDYIAEAESYKRSIIHNTVFKRTLATAACLLLCVGIYWGTRSINNSDSMSTVDIEGQGVKSTASDEAVQREQGDVSATDAGANIDYMDTVSKVEGLPESYPTESDSNQNQFPTSESAEQTVQNPQEEHSSVSKDATNAGVQAAETESMYDTVLQMPADKMHELSAAKERLTSYPNTLEELRQESVYLILHGVADTGQEKWDEFLQSINGSEPASIEIVQFTVEGDPIITALYFDGQTFHATRDNSRDAWAGAEAGITENTYKHLYIFQIDDQTEAVLSQEAHLTIEDWQSGAYETYLLFQCKTE